MSTVRTFDGVYCSWCVAADHVACERTIAEQAATPDATHTQLCACSHDLTAARVPGAGDARMYPENEEATLARRQAVTRAQAEGRSKPAAV